MSEKSKSVRNIGSKVRDRVRQWLDELFPIIFPPVPSPVPVRDDHRRR